jgi:hypothetical protein
VQQMAWLTQQLPLTLSLRVEACVRKARKAIGRFVEHSCWNLGGT